MLLTSGKSFRGCRIYPRHKRQEYVIEANERLRLVMAEYHQIRCRGLFEDVGFQAWTRPATILAEIESSSPEENFRAHGRQMGAFLDLLMLNNQAPGIRFWA